jgi:hypothetical protein
MEKYCSACSCSHESPKWYNSKTIPNGFICKSSYLKEYHEQNKNKVNEKRRNQYKEDTEHREKIKEKNNKNRIERGYKKIHKPSSERTEEEKQKAKEAKQRYRAKHSGRICEANKKQHAKHYKENIEKYRITNKENRKILEYQYSNLKSNAARRNIVFELTLDQYKSKRTMLCHYCNKQLEETGNCLDRIDNAIRIYNDTNTTPCCHICNYLKGSILSEEETLFAILALKKFHIDGILPEKIMHSLYSPKAQLTGKKLKYKYTHFKANLKFRNFTSSLSFEDFVALFKKSECFYCGGESTGLDRIDNNIGYDISNCVPCCKACNHIKGDIFEYEETFVMINAIQRVRMSHIDDHKPSCIICDTSDSAKWFRHPDENTYLCSDHYKDIFKQKNEYYDSQIDFPAISNKFYERLSIRRETRDKHISTYSLSTYEKYKKLIASRGMELLTDFEEYLLQPRHKVFTILCKHNHTFKRDMLRTRQIETCPDCTGHSNKGGAFKDKLTHYGWTYISGEYKNKSSEITARAQDGTAVTKQFRWFRSNPYRKVFQKNQSTCHQKIIRDNRLEQDLAIVGKDILEVPLSEYILQMVPFESRHRKFIETYEWLGSVGNSPKWTFEAICDGHLAGVILFNEPSSYSKNLLHINTKEMECLIQRGACASWAHRHLGSKLVMFGCRWLAANTSKKIFVAYSDPEANEIGTIYQACNFDYLGNGFGATYKYKHATFKKGNYFSAQTLRRTSTLKGFLKTLNISWNTEWQKENGFKDLSKLPVNLKEMWYSWGDNIIKESQKIKVTPKGKYVLVLGRNKREQNFLNKEKKYEKESYPKRTL